MLCVISYLYVVMQWYTNMYVSACLVIYMVWLLYNHVLFSCYLVVKDGLLHKPGIAVQLHS